MTDAVRAFFALVKRGGPVEHHSIRPVGPEQRQRRGLLLPWRVSQPAAAGSRFRKAVE